MGIVAVILLSMLVHGITGAKTFPGRSPLTLIGSSSSSSGGGGIMAGMSRLDTLDVKCGRTGIDVELRFTLPFPGVVYSKGHFSDPACLYVKDGGRRSDVYRFTIPVDGCGTRPQEEEEQKQYRSSSSSSSVSLANTIIIQTDALIQEVWDEAREITCTWTNRMEKSVAFLPIKVYEPDTIHVELDQRAVNTLMEIHVEEEEGLVRGRRKGRRSGPPLPSPPTGYVHMGDDISVVMYVKGRSMDANPISCNASTASRRGVVQLVDQRGCLLRPDLMTPFTKTANTAGVDADLMLYSYLKAFNIAESPEFTISCDLEICEGSCPKLCNAGGARKKRSQEEEEEEEGKKRSQEEEEEEEGKKRRVKLERSVLVLSKRKESGGERECLYQSSTALLALALLMTLASALGALSALLGFKLWSLKARMRTKGVLH